MELMFAARAFDQTAHPGTNRNCVGLKVEDNGHASPQQIDDVRSDGFAKPVRATSVISNSLDFARIQAGEQLVLTDQNGPGIGSEFRGQCRFTRPDFSAEQMQCRSMFHH